MDTMTQLALASEARYQRVLAESEIARFRAGLVQSLLKGLLIGYAVYVGIDVIAVSLTV